MNILQITPNILTKRCSNSTVTGSNYSLNQNVSYPNLRPLASDTVSFSGKAKIVKEIAETVADEKTKILAQRTKEVSYQLCKKVAEESEQPLRELLRTLKHGLKTLVATEAHPNNPILHGGIKGRVKSPRSIAEKAISRHKYSQKEIDTMGDVIGARIVMRSTTKEDFNILFDSLTKMVKNGDLKIVEIENYRSSPKSSYVASKTLDKFEETCNKMGLYPKKIEGVIPNGYTAIHLTAELPQGKLAEIQIMGRDVENVKEIEDFFYKYRGKKPLDPKYKQINDILRKFMPKLDEFQQATLDRYIKDSYLNARDLPPKNIGYKGSVIKDFLPFPYSLPQELSYQNLYKLKEQCDRAAKELSSTQR